MDEYDYDYDLDYADDGRYDDDPNPVSRDVLGGVVDKRKFCLVQRESGGSREPPAGGVEMCNSFMFHLFAQPLINRTR